MCYIVYKAVRMKGIRINTLFDEAIGKQIMSDAEKEGNRPTVIVRRIVTQFYKKAKAGK
jgi:hypothetical protein